MLRGTAWAMGILVTVGAALFVGFTVSFRTKFGPVHKAIRRFNRDVTNPRQLKGSAGGPGAWASVVNHVGRTSGTGYRTPVVAVPTDDGFLFALPYGPDADWVRNVLTASKATLEHDGQTIPVTDPELITPDEANPRFPAKEQRMHRLYGVNDFLLVRRAGEG